jgi:ankyrin repeat protein
MIEKILEYKVDVNIKTKAGFTPIYLACEAGHYDTVQKLLECKAKMDSNDKIDKTPLFIACIKNRETIVHLILAKGASVNKKINMVLQYYT